MSDLLKILPIYILSTLTGIWFNFFNFQFIFSKIKSGQYTIPWVKHTFQGWETFTVAAWSFNILFCYIPATLLVAYTYKISVERYGGLSSAVIVGWISNILTQVLFVRLLAGERLNRNGWIAVFIILMALPFAAHSSTNVKP